jgi:hypothetical protein
MLPTYVHMVNGHFTCQKCRFALSPQKRLFHVRGSRPTAQDLRVIKVGCAEIAQFAILLIPL